MAPTAVFAGVIVADFALSCGVEKQQTKQQQTRWQGNYI
jgi:hypothetical protein